jgi:hypothetical protein
MHILEQYSLNCGLKIGKPFIYKKFYPLPFDKYITFNPFGKFNSRKYSYWQDVVDILHPVLSDHNIKIIQLGGKDEPNYTGCYNAAGITNLNQSAYIISNSLLHFGVDSFPVHAASAFDKKIVALYCNMYASQSKPYWSKEEDVSLIQADLKGKKPSYAPEENPKTIDSIKPELIANEILKKLEIKNKVEQNSIFFGENYPNLELDFIPDSSILIDKGINQTLNVRFDLLDKPASDEQINIAVVNIQKRKCRIYLSDIIPVDFLKHPELRKNTESIIFKIKDYSVETKKFISKLKSIGGNIKYIACSKTFNTEEKFSLLKLEMLDYCLVEKEQLKPIENEIKKQILKNKNSLTFYKSCRIIYSKGESFISEAALKEKKSTTSFVQKIKDIKNIDLLLEKDHSNIYIFNKK